MPDLTPSPCAVSASSKMIFPAQRTSFIVFLVPHSHIARPWEQQHRLLRRLAFANGKDKRFPCVRLGCIALRIWSANVSKAMCWAAGFVNASKHTVLLRTLTIRYISGNLLRFQCAESFPCFQHNISTKHYKTKSHDLRGSRATDFSHGFKILPMRHGGRYESQVTKLKCIEYIWWSI